MCQSAVASASQRTFWLITMDCFDAGYVPASVNDHSLRGSCGRMISSTDIWELPDLSSWYYSLSRDHILMQIWTLGSFFELAQEFSIVPQEPAASRAFSRMLRLVGHYPSACLSPATRKTFVDAILHLNHAPTGDLRLAICEWLAAVVNEADNLESLVCLAYSFRQGY